ncbi:hypothetical protein BC936DRAFT_145010 [Jimgerdemannia flammicorona]|uniref:Uncharacterized protein n=1 Tax=Jimgerdemannia flammicorona TaxID=994334 RepID=A0A433DB39_9FUNG|nr:hypothetical protein BC936DRAFT_145010 [Jimgerdemannia flammicorona]
MKSLLFLLAILALVNTITCTEVTLQPFIYKNYLPANSPKITLKSGACYTFISTPQSYKVKGPPGTKYYCVKFWKSDICQDHAVITYSKASKPVISQGYHSVSVTVGSTKFPCTK